MQRLSVMTRFNEMVRQRLPSCALLGLSPNKRLEGAVGTPQVPPTLCAGLLTALMQEDILQLVEHSATKKVELKQVRTGPAVTVAGVLQLGRQRIT